MRVKKIVSLNMEKCYAISPFQLNNNMYFMAATEKLGSCLLCNLKGEVVETVWSNMGGTMSIVQVSKNQPCFLAIQKFFSPDDSKQAKIVLGSRNKNGSWSLATVGRLPHVHRLDILSNGVDKYLLAATLCSERHFNGDWGHPGKVYACKLPKNVMELSEDNPLLLDVIKDDLTKNHGYFRYAINKMDTGIIGADNGIFQFIPPNGKHTKWQVKQLAKIPVSDMALGDLDNDGEEELLTIEPFHGDVVRIWKRNDSEWKAIYQVPFSMPFSHALWCGKLNGKTCAVLGYRQQEQALCIVEFNNRKFTTHMIDKGIGPANVWCFDYRGKSYIVSANREHNELALYLVI